jgi:hypothetical protein
MSYLDYHVRPNGYMYRIQCNNSVVEKIYGMAYVFTLLMFRKPNKTTINKNKTTIFISQHPFDSRLYLDISRSFK